MTNPCPQSRRLHSAVVGALLFAFLSLGATSPARAQAAAPAPADSHAALTPAEAQRALDALQDAGKRDELVETTVTIVGQIVCTDSGRWPVQREFNRRMKMRFQQLGLDIAYPAQTRFVVDEYFRERGGGPRATPRSDIGERA